MTVQYVKINKYNEITEYPEVDLIFTGPKKSLVDRVSGKSLQFTRNTIGTYVDANGIIQTAAAGEPRYTYDPITGEELGLMVEESRTNESINSEVFTDTGGGTLTWTPNAANAPDGNPTAYKLVPTTGFVDRNSANLSPYINGSNNTVTASVFVKKDSLRYAHISLNSSTNYYSKLFDLDTGEFVDENTYNNPQQTSSTSEKLKNGWYRISITKFADASETTIRIEVGSTDTATPNYPYGQVSYTPDGTSGMYFWGAQLEEGSFPTSYIPTTSSTVSRDPDTVTLTNDNLYNNSEFDIINQPFGVAAGSNTLQLLPSDKAIKRVSVFSPNLTQTRVNQFAEKEDEFWRWRVKGDSFGLPTYVTSDGNMTIDWGDGTVEEYSSTFLAGSNAISHTFVDGKEYHDVGFRLDSGTYFRPRVFQDSTSRSKLISIGPAPENMKVDLDAAFRDCVNLESIDSTFIAGGGTNNAASAFRSCTKLKSFPKIDTSNIGSFSEAWFGLNNLTNFPLIDTSSGTNFSSAWRNCSSLTTFPEINTSSGGNFSYAWTNCSSLTEFPSINTSNGSDFGIAWQACTSLTSFPPIDVSLGRTFTFSWAYSTNLTTFPANFFDSWNPTTIYNNCFYNTWDGCTSLTATSVENILTSISVSAASGTPPASGTDITISYNTASGTPDITVPAVDLILKGWIPTLNGSAKNDAYSSDFATLDLDFATNLSLTDNISGNDLVTFSRDSIGTFVDSDGLVKKSFNLCKYSEEFDNTTQQGWTSNTPGQDVILTGGQSDPNGATSAYLFDNGTLNSFHYLYGNAQNRPSINANQNITASVFVKAGSARYLFLGCGFNVDGFAVIFDTQTNTLGTPAAFGTATIVGSPTVTSYSGGWYRISVSGVFSGTAPRLVTLGINDSSTLGIYYGNSYTGANDTGYFWGAQLEENSTVTTYIKTTSLPAGGPRFDHDPDTLESLGLLVEEARTNISTYSEIASAWTLIGGQTTNVSSNVIDAPDGNTTADLIYGASGNLTALSLQNGTTLNNNWWIIASIFVKKVPGSKYGFINLNVSAVGSGVPRINLNLDTGETITYGGVSGYAIPFPNGWYRLVCSVRNTSGATQTTWNGNSVRIFAVTTNTDQQGTGTGTGSTTDGVYVWGRQVEKTGTGDFVSSYIPTGATSGGLSRGADVMSITGTNFSSWYNNNEGTFFTDMAYGFTQNAGSPLIFGGVIYDTVTGGVRTLANTPTIMGGLSNSQTVPSKTAVALKSQDFRVYRDGTQTGSNTSLSYTPTGTQLLINSFNGSKGRIGRIAYWPKRLTDTSLQYLTQ